MPQPTAFVAASAATLVAPLTAIVAWFAIGDLTDVDPRSVEGGLDYAWRAPDLPGWLGVVAAIVLAVCVTVLAVDGDDREFPGWGWAVVGCLAAAAALLAVIGRVMSAGTIGANIGAGLAVLFLGPVVAALVVAAAVTAGVALVRRAARAR